MKKILIAIPTFDGKLSIDIINFLDSLIIPKGYSKTVSFIKRTPIDIARNMYVKSAIEGGYEYLFFVDDDTIPPKDVLVKMIYTGLGITTGLYRARGGDKKLLIYNKIKGDKPFYYNVNKINIAIGTIHKVDACGAGCLLIKTSILKDMVNVYGDNLFEMKTMYFYEGKEYLFDKPLTDLDKVSSLVISEDICFCERATSMMYYINADTRVLCKHIGDNGPVSINKSMYCENGDDEITILLKEGNLDKIEKHLLNNIKSNYICHIVGDTITEDDVSSITTDYVAYFDNIEIPYSLDIELIRGLRESTITGPLTLGGTGAMFRNDNIVTHCWAMKTVDLKLVVPIPTKLEDFTLHRKIKKNKGVCGILDATIKLNDR